MSANIFAGAIFASFAVLLGQIHPILIAFPAAGTALWAVCRRARDLPSSEETGIEEHRWM